jgi:hypothetical protein
MAESAFYRGGDSLAVRPHEVRVDPATGLVQPTHGVSVFDRPDQLDRFGGAFQITEVPDTLKIIQRGRDVHHHEIVPVAPLTLEEFQAELKRIVLVPV